MAFLDKEDLHNSYSEAVTEANLWREDYHEYERLADNDLLPDLDENLPETNDGSLAASLFKLPKRIVSSKLTGRAKALDVDDAWITELANIQWENDIIPNANSQAPFHRKWKDVVRKAAIYGGQPIITLFVNNGSYTGADFIVPQAQDVTLEAGKVSDYDSDVIYWDVYYSKLQVERMIEQAKEEQKEAKANGEESYNTWDIKALQEILDSKQEEDRDSDREHNKKSEKSVKRSGIHFCIVFQRGVKAPFYMYHKGTNKAVREWENPDPTGDVPVHYLYCYQDFINPYGIGIVKLAGGTQNVLDYMRQADVLATQLGVRPPKLIEGTQLNGFDEDSLVYAQDANWFVGDAKVIRLEMANGVYTQLPQRISMYKTSLNQLIPVGDTSINAGAGDPNYSKTPAGVKFQENNLSIDDEDFKDNLYMTYAAVAKSMINTHFANMQGHDLVKLSDEQREILAKSGIEFPVDEEGNPSNELDVMWDEARATFDFEVDPEEDKTTDDQKRLEGLLKIVEFRQANPEEFDMSLQASGKKFNLGEAISTIVKLTSDNDKIVEDIDPEEMEQMEAEEQLALEQQADMGQEEFTDEPLEQTGNFDTVAEILESYNVDEATAQAMIAAEQNGFSVDEILEKLSREAQPVEEEVYV